LFGSDWRSSSKLSTSASNIDSSRVCPLMTSQIQGYSNLAPNARNSHEKKEEPQMTSYRAHLENWADEVLEVMGQEFADKVEDSRSNFCFDSDVPWSEMKRMMDEDPNPDPEIIAAAIMQCQIDENVDSDEKREAVTDEMKDAVDASANFVLNISVVSTLLLSIQIPMLLAPVEPHPLISCYAEKWFGTTVIGEDDYFLQGDTMSTRPIQACWAIYIMEQLVAMCLLPSIYHNLEIVMVSAKGYGALTWWCPDLGSQAWFRNTVFIGQFQEAANTVIPEFILSLVPYIMLTRGPLLGFALIFVYRRVVFNFFKYDFMSKMSIATRFALKMKDKTLFTDAGIAKSKGRSTKRRHGLG